MPNFFASSLEAVIPFMAGVLCILLGYKKTAVNLLSPWLNRFLRWAGPALIVFAVFLFLIGGGSRSVDAETIATGIRAKMNLPVRVDQDTRLDDVRAVSNTELGYFLTLTTIKKAQLSGNLIATQLENNLRAGACRNPDYAKFFKQGISLRITYQTQDQAEITKILFTPKDCGF